MFTVLPQSARLESIFADKSDSIMSPPPTLQESGLFENIQTWGCYDGPKGLIMHSMDFFTDAGKDS